jgi:hypothetical protein
MPSGGPRPNSGRPKGSKTKHTKMTPSARHRVTDRLVAKCAGKDTSPMEVMLDSMIFFDRQAKRGIAKLERLREDSPPWRRAYHTTRARLADSVAVARDLAPYVHAKLQSVTVKGDKNSPLEVALGLRSAEELRALVRGRKGKGES